MSEVKHFRFRDLDLTPTADGPTLPLVNVGYSHDLGAGIGAFENCAVPWTVTYDEVLFIKEGVLTLRVAGQVFRAGEGDVLWIPGIRPWSTRRPRRWSFSMPSIPPDARPRPARRPSFRPHPPARARSGSAAPGPIRRRDFGPQMG
jgi:hypothetical protein